MGADKIASFYDDPVKQACDAWSMAKAVSFRTVIDRRTGYTGVRSAGRASLAWFGEGCLRRMRNGISAGSNRRAHVPRRHPRHRLVIVVVGLTGGVVRRVALVVPELAVDAVGREQLRMRAALDRLAA